MDYKEKYEMALERAKKFIEANPLVQNLNTWIKETFPELAESEDERIRNQIINFIEEYGNPIHCEWQKDWIAWLERQGEQKPITIDIDKMVNDYANNKERGNEDFGKPVPCMIRAYRQGLNDAIGKVVLKPAWSEDDDDAWMNDIISKVENNLQLNKAEIDWLKSLKTKAQPKQKWSGEDERNFQGVINEIEANKSDAHRMTFQFMKGF